MSKENNTKINELANNAIKTKNLKNVEINELANNAIKTKNLKNPVYTLPFGNISDKLCEIYEQLNDLDGYYDKYNIPIIKYNDFYFNLSDLYIEKNLLDTNVFEYKNFSYYLFKDGKINNNILDKKDTFSTFTTCLSKNIGPLKLYFNDLDISKFEIIDNSKLEYEARIENTLKYSTFDGYKLYLETKDELKIPAGSYPIFNKLSLSFIDKMNLFDNNKLFNIEDVNSFKGEYITIEQISNNILIYVLQLYKPNDFYHTEMYRIIQYKK